MPGIGPAYGAALRARRELTGLYHHVRGRIAPRPPVGFLGQAPRSCFVAPSPGLGLRELLAHAGVAFSDRGDELALTCDERTGGVLGEKWALYPGGATVRLARAPGATGTNDELRGALLAANLLHTVGAGPRPYDALELRAGDERWLGLVSAPTGEDPELDRAHELLRTGVLRVVGATDDRAPRWDQLRVVDREAFITAQLDRQAQRDLHFGREIALRGGRYLYQSVPTVGATGRRDSARRWSLVSCMLQRASVDLRDRVVCDVGCNAGMMLAAALSDEAAWGLGWDLSPVVDRARRLLFGLGYSRFDLFGAELHEDYPLESDVPRQLRDQLHGSVVLYLAIRHHVGFLRALERLPWSALVYEGGETESVARLDRSLAGLRALCDFSVAEAVDFRDSETSARPVALLLRK